MAQDRTRGLLARIFHAADASAEIRIATVEPVRTGPVAAELHASAPDALLFLQLTSGSTGVAKCIQETHRGVVAHVHGVTQLNGYRDSDVTLNWLSMDHVAPTGRQRGRRGGAHVRRRELGGGSEHRQRRAGDLLRPAISRRGETRARSSARSGLRSGRSWGWLPRPWSR